MSNVPDPFDQTLPVDAVFHFIRLFQSPIVRRRGTQSANVPYTFKLTRFPATASSSIKVADPYAPASQIAGTSGYGTFLFYCTSDSSNFAKTRYLF